jgi:hypothetical protein
VKKNLYLPPALWDCPDWWKKIVDDIGRDAPDTADCSKEVRKFLKTYNARFLNDPSPVGIEFDSEEDFIIFKLRHM